MGVVPLFLLECLYPDLEEVVLDTQVPGGQGSSPWQLPGYGKNCVQYLREALHEDQLLGLYLSLLV